MLMSVPGIESIAFSYYTVQLRPSHAGVPVYKPSCGLSFILIVECEWRLQKKFDINLEGGRKL